MICDEVGRDVASVDLHAFHEFLLVGQALGLFDGDDPVFADLLHDVGDEVAHLVVVSGEGSDLADLSSAFDRSGHVLNGASQSHNALFDAALEGHWVGTGGDVLESFVNDGLGQHCRSSGAVTSHVVRLAGGFFE